MLYFVKFNISHVYSQVMKYSPQTIKSMMSLNLLKQSPIFGHKRYFLLFKITSQWVSLNIFYIALIASLG